MKSQFFNFWNVILWMKIQNAAWFKYKNFPCCNHLLFLNLLYSCMEDMFAILRKYLFMKLKWAYIFRVMKSNEWKIRIILIINLCIRNKKLGRSLQNFHTHDHFGNLIYFSVKSHILENTAYLARRWIDYPSGNTTSLYLWKIIYVFNC